MKGDYNEETYGYYSCDEGLINILMKEKYLKKWIMKKIYGFKFSNDKIFDELQEKMVCFGLEGNVTGKEEIRFFGLEEIAENIVDQEN